MQVLLKSKKYQLCWLPEKFCRTGLRLKIEGWQGIWEVKEVYTEKEEVIKEGNKVIWEGKTNPVLQGKDLEERLVLYKRKLKRVSQIEEV